MGLSFTKLPVHEDRVGRRLYKYYEIAFDSSYPTGGEEVSAARLGLKKIDGVHVIGHDTSAAGYFVDYNFETGKLQAFVSAGFTPAGTNSAPTFTGSAMSAHSHTLHLNDGDVADGATTRVNAGSNLLGANTGSDISITGVADTSGRGGIVNASAGTPAGTVSAPTFTGTAVAAAALAEVANATNLSALRVRAVVIGR